MHLALLCQRAGYPRNQFGVGRLLSQRELVDDNGDGNLEADSTIWFQIQMIGLGGFGGQVDSLLERSIPGYRRQYD